MNLHPRLIGAIKITSTVVITGALGLEVWNLSGGFQQNEMSGFWQILLILVHFGLLAHLIEGILAGFLSPRHQALQAGVYTFFTGTVSLWEIYQRREEGSTSR